MKRFLILATLFAAACQPMPADGGKTDYARAASTAPAAATPAIRTVAAQTPPAGGEDAAACEARGGKMLPQGRMQTLRCVVRYADAGRRCTDGDDCQGDCRVEDVADAPQAGANAAGQCQANSGRFGCYTTIEGGKAEATICVD